MKRISCQQPFGANFACFRALLGLLLAMFSFSPDSTEAQSPASKEYQLKAAFLFNFAQFVEWPANTFTNDDQPFTIGVLGEDSFGKSLEETIQGETIQKHKLVVKRAQSAEDLKGCQLVFVCKSEKGRLPEILSKLGSRNILTVGEFQGFANRGGAINFYIESNKVRFEINLAAAQHEGLKISSQLLSLGKIVESEPSRTDK